MSTMTMTATQTPFMEGCGGPDGTNNNNGEINSSVQQLDAQTLKIIAQLLKSLEGGGQSQGNSQGMPDGLRNRESIGVNKTPVFDTQGSNNNFNFGTTFKPTIGVVMPQNRDTESKDDSDDSGDSTGFDKSLLNKTTIGVVMPQNRNTDSTDDSDDSGDSTGFDKSLLNKTTIGVTVPQNQNSPQNQNANQTSGANNSEQTQLMNIIAELEEIVVEKEMQASQSGGLDSGSASEISSLLSVTSTLTSMLSNGTNGSSGTNGTDGTNSGNSTNNTSNDPKFGACGDSAAQGADYKTTVLNGDCTTLPKGDEKCPPGVSMDDMMKADGGLLAKMGNQTMTGDGAKGITGGIKDNLAKIAGGKDASQIGTDPDVTWRALQAAQAMKNVPGSDGKPIPDDVRHNGNMSGYNPSGEIDRGSPLGLLQDLSKGAIKDLPQQQPQGDGHVNADGTEKSGIQMFGDKVKGFFQGIGNAIKNFFVNGVGGFFKGLGNGIKDFFTGHFGNALRDVVGGVQGVVGSITSAPSTVLDSMGLGNTGFGKAVGKVTGFIDDTFNNLTNTVAAPAEHMGDFEDHLVHGQFNQLGNDLKEWGTSAAKLGIYVAAGVATDGAADAFLPELDGAVSAGLSFAGKEGIRHGDNEAFGKDTTTQSTDN